MTFIFWLHNFLDKLYNRNQCLMGRVMNQSRVKVVCPHRIEKRFPVLFIIALDVIKIIIKSSQSLLTWYVLIMISRIE